MCGGRRVLPPPGPFRSVRSSTGCRRTSSSRCTPQPGWSTSSSRARGSRPCIIVVDDAHLLDDTSAFMLAQLVDRRLARLVLTVCGGARDSGRRLGAVARQAASASRPAAARQGRLFDSSRIGARRLGGSGQRAQAVEPDARQCELPAAHRRTGCAPDVSIAPTGHGHGWPAPLSRRRCASSSNTRWAI